MRILMMDGAEPVAVHQPASILAHWQEKVKKDIEWDMRLWVLEWVPANTPVTRCSRMHVVAKKNGDPRRVVDLQRVNAQQRGKQIMWGPHLSQQLGSQLGLVGFLRMHGTGTTRCHWTNMTGM